MTSTPSRPKSCESSSGTLHVQRLAPDPEAPYLIPPHPRTGLLPSYDEMSRRITGGAQIAAEIGPAGTPRLYFTDTSFDRDDADAPAGPVEPAS